MMSSSDNEVLVRTNAGTPMGEYFRRYWLPFALSRELAEPDGAPIRVKVMGEELVAFRDTNGRVGLIEPHCAHRGTNLFFGRNEECGLRCVHHGWKYDVEGKCVDMPNVPPGAAMQGKVSIRAYPTREFGEMVWAYFGPKQTMPEVPQLEHALLPGSHRYVTKRLQQCNWAQSMDGALDTAHFSFLHMPAPGVRSNDPANIAADENRIRWLRADPMPQFTIVEHDVGFVLGGSRRADGEELYWRITQFMLPSHSITPSAMPGEIYYGYTWVPVDDESCWIYVYGWHPDRAITNDERAKFEKGGYGQFAELGPGYLPIRNRGNDYLIDRNEQKLRSFTGVRGIAEQDTLAQESQGPIADRTREHLTATDVGVAHFRRLMIREARALAAGTEPAAARRHASYRLRSGGAVLDSRLSFEDVMKQRFGTATGAVP
ncbi:MAG TPA: Rieske 2Fe-2S domain-containing protein [Burkholderiales bacterium]|jgi:phenylpropionate dioxygenase-like ring-hydroxylating dioxygenase large terminal subunit|nr:Rieske 2Fe-2S domain-containing protein [Burkholderiales bacterium]